MNLQKTDSNNYNTEKNDVIDIMSDFDDVEQGVENDDHDNTVNETFFNPTQVENTPCEKMFKCENCEYRAARKSEVVNHKITIYNCAS